MFSERKRKIVSQKSIKTIKLSRTSCRYSGQIQSLSKRIYDQKFLFIVKVLVDFPVELVDLYLVGLDDIRDEKVAKEADKGLDICPIDETTLAWNCVRKILDSHGPFETRAKKARVRRSCCRKDGVKDGDKDRWLDTDAVNAGYGNG